MQEKNKNGFLSSLNDLLKITISLHVFSSYVRQNFTGFIGSVQTLNVKAYVNPIAVLLVYVKKKHYHIISNQIKPKQIFIQIAFILR